MLATMQNSSIGLAYAPFDSNSRSSMTTPIDQSAVNTANIRTPSSEETSEGIEAGDVDYLYKASKNELEGEFGSMNLYVPGGITIANLREFHQDITFFF